MPPKISTSGCGHPHAGYAKTCRPCHIATRRQPVVPCAVQHCHELAKVRGWCKFHYNRWQKRGDPLYSYYEIPVEERFWIKVDKTGGPDSCWPWIAGFRNGYGAFTCNRVPSNRAHVVAYGLTHGAWPIKGIIVRHTCDNPPCCNPAHLILGTNKENSEDMVRRGRARRFDETHVAKLTWDTAGLLWRCHEAGEPTRLLAQAFGLSRAHVGRIFRSRLWHPDLRPK